MSSPTTRALWENLVTRGNADFLVLPDHLHGFGDLERAVRQWLAAFDAAGLVPGDRIVLRSGNEPAVMSCAIAAILDDIVPVILSADTPQVRLQSICDTVSPSLVVIDEPGDAQAPLPTGNPILVLRSAVPVPRGLFRARKAAEMLPGFAHSPATRLPRLPIDDAGLAYILFTSGTTASPSGVEIRRGNLFANLATLRRVFGYDKSSRIFNDMAVSHADGLVQGPLLAMANGCALIRSGGFRLGQMEAWLGRVRATRATHVVAPPTNWSMIHAYARHDDYFDAPECVALLSVAAKMPAELWAALEARFQRPLFNQYGLTETVTSALYAGPQAEMGASGVGKPIDCEARIDPNSLRADEGELHLRGANIFGGYWRNPERTKASFTDDGWFRTGDLARCLPDGGYDILGRLKSAIKSGGFLIRPEEIDEAMSRHPAVMESVTVAIADAVFEEVPMTVVVLGEPVDAITLTDHARMHLEAYKVPKRIVAVSAIPRGEAGKPSLPAIRAMLLAALSEGAPAEDVETDIQSTVLAVAAAEFRVPPETLSPRTTSDDVAGWDSFTQLTLLLAIEQALDVRIPASKVATIETLGDIIGAVSGLRR